LTVSCRPNPCQRSEQAGGASAALVDEKDRSGCRRHQFNHNRHAVALTSGSAKLAAYYEYDAWGNTMTEAERTGVENPYRYSTKEWDEKSGLYYFGARYYSPEIGRWTQRDPAGTVDGLNLYVYAFNSPSSILDEWGEAAGWPVQWGEDPGLAKQLDKAKEEILKQFRPEKKPKKHRLPRSKIPGCLTNALTDAVDNVIGILDAIPGEKFCLLAIESLK